jgi:hypothetical protein
MSITRVYLLIKTLNYTDYAGLPEDMIDQKKEIQQMLLARFPLLWVVSPEEEPAEEILCDVVKGKEGQIYFWDFARGWTDSGTAKGNPMQALERISKAPAMEQITVFVMKDLATLIAPGANGQIVSKNSLLAIYSFVEYHTNSIKLYSGLYSGRNSKWRLGISVSIFLRYSSFL